MQISVSWGELRKLALCAGLAVAFDRGLGTRARGVLAGLDTQHPHLPSLVTAADAVSREVTAAGAS